MAATQARWCGDCCLDGWLEGLVAYHPWRDGPGRSSSGISVRGWAATVLDKGVAAWINILLRSCLGRLMQPWIGLAIGLLIRSRLLEGTQRELDD